MRRGGRFPPTVLAWSFCSRAIQRSLRRSPTCLALKHPGRAEGAVHHRRERGHCASRSVIAFGTLVVLIHPVTIHLRSGGEVAVGAPAGVLALYFLLLLLFTGGVRFAARSVYERPLRGFRPSKDARRVLIVDDNVDAAESLAMLLRLEGHKVQVAHSGAAALQLAAASPPEVAFLDLGMPVMSGYELAAKLREHPVLRSVNLIAMTGWGQDEDRRRSKEAGFDHHMTKPVALAALQQILKVGALDEPLPG